MTIDPRRVALLVPVIALAIVLVARAWLRDGETTQAGTDSVPERTFPVIDAGDANTRHALMWLRDRKDDRWIGARCNDRSRETYEVGIQRTPMEADFHYRQATFDLDASRVWYRGAHGWAPDEEASPPRVAPVDAEAAGRLRALLAESGYPAATPTVVDRMACHHFGEIVIESCVDANYYGLLRTCPGSAEEVVAVKLLDLAEALVEKRE
jgi:hypothetical protein